MVDLVLRPSGLPEKENKPWALQLRYHECLGPTEYETLCTVNDHNAKEIIRAGKARWLFGEPDWSDRARSNRLEEARVLRERADALENMCEGSQHAN